MATKPKPIYALFMDSPTLGKAPIPTALSTNLRKLKRLIRYCQGTPRIERFWNNTLYRPVRLEL